jgi:hypothetical protein
LQLRERLRALARALAQNSLNGDPCIVLENRQLDAAEELERLHVAVAERFRRLRRIRDDEAGVRVRLIEREEVVLRSTPAMTASASPKSA